MQQSASHDHLFETYLINLTKYDRKKYYIFYLYNFFLNYKKYAYKLTATLHVPHTLSI